MTRISLAVAAATTLFAQGAMANAPSNQELFDIIQAQQEQIEDLQGKKSDGASVFDRLSIGAYGELHYNNLDADNAANDVDQIDFHRFVLFFGYQYSDRIRFYSEFELEHSLAGEGAPGEVELEQAFVEFSFDGNNSALGGVYLIPVGILNETHEPPTFYGVERNDVESIIIPATWWAGGAQYTWRSDSGLQWDIGIHEGLAIPTMGGSAFRVRSGRQKTAEALANDFAATTRLKYTGVPGLELAASAQFQSDASQISNDGLDEGVLTTAHMVLNRGIFGFRALYANWQFEGDAVEAADDDSQTGWYVEPSIKVHPQVGLYTRYEDLEGARDRDEFDQVEVGVNYWPHPQVVLKADFRSRSHNLVSEEGRDFDGFDLGIGYFF